MPAFAPALVDIANRDLDSSSPRMQTPCSMTSRNATAPNYLQSVSSDLPSPCFLPLFQLWLQPLLRPSPHLHPWGHPPPPSFSPPDCAGRLPSKSPTSGRARTCSSGPIPVEHGTSVPCGLQIAALVGFRGLLRQTLLHNRPPRLMSPPPRIVTW